ncbi:chitobiase/beta-hexosaminidase C-terminal domain-containing protein [Bacteroidota bacterium]
MNTSIKSIVTGFLLLLSLCAFSIENGEIITITRIDGEKIEGIFVRQDEQKVVVVSPKTGMAQSIQLDHIFKLAKKKLNKKRKFTEDEKQWLQEVLWADTYKKKDDNPYYLNETWEEGRLLIWANPGQDGDFMEPSNWIENNKPATSAPDMNTDVLLPFSDSLYNVRSDTKNKVRHVTIERNASFLGKHRNDTEVWGNVWRKPGSIGWGMTFVGEKNTFYLAEKVEFPNLQKFPNQLYAGSKFVKSPYAICHKFQVCKYGDASVEFIGKFGITDEIAVQHGRLILNGEMRWSGSTRKGAMEIYDGAVLELQSGAIAAPFAGLNRRNVYNMDIYRNGLLQAGSPERPLKEDVYILLGFEKNDVPGYSGLYMAEGSQLRVYTEDPTKARLVFSSITSVADFCDVRGNNIGNPEQKAFGNTGITMQLSGDIQMNGVVFDYVSEEGIKLANQSMKDDWKNITYGDNNATDKDKLFAGLTMDGNIYYHTTRSKREYILTSTAVSTMEEYMQTVDPYKIEVTPKAAEVKTVDKITKPVTIVYNESIDVTLISQLADSKLYYTLDGSIPKETSNLYNKPITLSETTRLRVRGFKEGEKPSPAFSAVYVFE